MSRKGTHRCGGCGEYANSRHRCQARKVTPPSAATLPDESSFFTTLLSFFRRKTSPAHQLDLFPSLPSAKTVSLVNRPETADTVETSNTDTRDVWGKAEEDGLLPLFASAREILDKFEPLEGDRTRPLESLPVVGEHFLFQRKLRESRVAVIGRSATLFERIQEEGVTDAICLQWTEGRYRGIRSIVNGHHRLAVLREIKPDTPVPVAFFSTLFDAFAYEEEPNQQWEVERKQRKTELWY